MVEIKKKVEWDPVSMTDKVLDLMSQGYLKCEIAAELNIPYGKLLKWRKIYPDFDELLQLGETYSMAWWAKKGRNNLKEEKFNHMLWYKIMCNAHGYGDRPSERRVEIEEWRGGVYEKIKVLDEMLSTGKMCPEQYQHLFKSLDFHTKINEIMYVAPMIAKIDLERRYKAGEIDKVIYEQELFILEQNKLMREIASKNIMNEAKIPKNLKVKPKLGRPVKNKTKFEELENTYIEKKKDKNFVKQLKDKRKINKQKKESNPKSKEKVDSNEIFFDYE